MITFLDLSNFSKLMFLMFLLLAFSRYLTTGDGLIMSTIYVLLDFRTNPISEFLNGINIMTNSLFGPFSGFVGGAVNIIYTSPILLGISIELASLFLVDIARLWLIFSILYFIKKPQALFDVNSF